MYRGYARITSPEITRKSDQAVWAIGAIAACITYPDGRLAAVAAVIRHLPAGCARHKQRC